VADELGVIEQWIVDTLLASSDVTDIVEDRIFDEPPPKGTRYPYIEYNMVSGSDVRTGVGTHRIFSDTIFTVKAVAASGNAPGLAELAGHIDAALTLISPTPVDAIGIVDGCVRERPVSFKEYTDGIHYEHRGGDFQVIARAT
jgi:hypothetical protein